MALSLADFHELVDGHAAALYRLAYRMVGDAHEAEDVVQETLRSAWCSRDRFDRGRSHRAWLAAILRRRVVDGWRRKGRTPQTTGDQGIDFAATTDDLTAAGYTDEMQHALDALSPDLREALLLVIVGELTHQEAADLLGVPLGTVLSRVSRARQRLRQQLIVAQKR